MSVRARARKNMAKVRMEARDGAKAKEIGAKAAAEHILAKVAKVGAAKVGEKETEATESRERLKGKVREKVRERRALMSLIMPEIGSGGARIGHRRIIADRVSIDWPLGTSESLHGSVDFVL